MPPFFPSKIVLIIWVIRYNANIEIGLPNAENRQRLAGSRAVLPMA